MIFSAMASRSAVVMPGRTSSTSLCTVRAVMRPATRIRSISSGDLRMIMAERSGDVGERGHDGLGYLQLGPIRLDLTQQSPVAIELQQRGSALAIDLEAAPDHIFVLVTPLDQGASAHVADALHAGRAEEHVVRGLAVGARSPSRAPLHR